MEKEHRAREMVQQIKCLMHKHKDQSSDPPQSHKKPSTATYFCSSSAEKVETEGSLPLGRQTDSLAVLVNSRFSETTVSKCKVESDRGRHTVLVLTFGLSTDVHTK